MPPTAVIPSLQSLERLATPANLAAGRTVLAQGGVLIDAEDQARIVARVGGVPAAESRRTVTVDVGAAGLTWVCACRKSLPKPCKHVVAAALAARS